MENETLDSKKRETIFRMNMYILEAMYNCFLEELASKLHRDVMGEMKMNCLYQILHTNRTDFSKYKNGIKPNITKKMTLLHEEIPELKTALNGKELIHVGEMTYEKCKEIISDTKTAIQKECKNQVQQLVRNIMPEIKKEWGTDIKEKESRICAWLGMRICIYWQDNHSEIDKRLKNKLESVKQINFNELDNCSFNLLKETMTEIKNIHLMVSKVYGYREMKERQKKKDENNVH